MTERSAELAGRLTAVRARIAVACDDAGRDPAQIVLIAVSKTWPVADIAALHDLGVADFGENRLPELQEKAGALAERDIRWHFVGQIQSKKAAAIGRVAPTIHSVDRARVVPGLARGAGAAGRSAAIFLQVSLAELAPTDATAGRGGAAVPEIPELAVAVASEPDLALAGLMTLPPRHADPEAAFARLAALSSDLQQRYPQARNLSAGMSHDFEAAIRAGATHIRVGSALFGERNVVR
jgi:pyridoxal phosphate enzyme (YggS family)